MSQAHRDYELASAACGAALLIILIIGIGCAAAFGPEFVKALIEGPASGWVQAIGSIGAILGSYHLGSRSFALAQREKRLEALETRKLRYELLIELFQQARALDVLAKHTFSISNANTWNSMRALAEDLLSQYSSIAAFDLPSAKQFIHLQRLRQVALTYVGYSSAIQRESRTLAQIRPWEDYAAGSIPEVDGFILEAREALVLIEDEISSISTK